MVLSYLSIWTQRAGRDKEPAKVILLVEPSMYQQRKMKKSAKSNELVGDCEDVEDGVANDEAQ